MNQVEITTMCMLVDGNRVLMINRKKSWPGWAFPGGHQEQNESIVQCIKREMYEETGLNVDKLQYKGTVNIYNPLTKKRLIVSNYIANHYTGILKKDCDEGDLSWIDINKITTLSTAEGLEYRLPIFFNEGINDLYIEWDKASHYTKVEYIPVRGYTHG